MKLILLKYAKVLGEILSVVNAAGVAQPKRHNFMWKVLVLASVYVRENS